MAEASCLAAAYRLQRTSRALRCFISSQRTQSNSCSATRATSTLSKPSIAPKHHIDIRHIRENPKLYEQNCLDRNYKSLATHPQSIVESFDKWMAIQYEANGLRQRNNGILQQMKGGAALEEPVKRQLLAEATELKSRIAAIKQEEQLLDDRIQTLASELPNLSSQNTPIGDEPYVLEYINEHPDSLGQQEDGVSHAEIGAELGILDLAAARNTTGWGFYYLKNEAALLEQALVQYALKTAREHGFQVVSPPSLVYSHISSACGFRPRDSGGEQQVYSISQQPEDYTKPELSLSGTAEIPFAAMKASSEMEAAELPLRIVGTSRCYRAEAGSRGIETKGLYRVHEFTKVEMFGWTLPDGSENQLFDLMVSIQKRILGSLGLHCRVLEQPTHDLGASASRKQDIEAFFPSRRERNSGWGELTSTSICTDYQTRRLSTRVQLKGKLCFPYTVNGTALAVPRVLAAILENHWDQTNRIVHIPEVLWPWMDGIRTIGPRERTMKRNNQV